MAPRTNIYQEYEDILSNRGLGSVPANNKSRLQLGIESGRLTDPSSIPEKSGTYIDELQRGLMNLGNIVKSGGLSQAFQPPKNIQEAAKQIEETYKKGTPDDFVPFDTSKFDAENAKIIANLAPGQKIPMKDSSSLLGAAGAGDSANSQNIIQDLIEKASAGQRAEDFRDKESQIAAMQGMPQENLVGKSVPVTEEDPSTTPPESDPIQNLFAGGMEEYIKAAQIPLPTQMSREQAMDKYKKEFAEATGLNIDGKPDKSLALMSLGLALMQNRAGKGFNVGKILSSVGEAGQAALPVLAQAKKEAKEAQMAAGQYALQMIKSDQDATQAIKTQNAAIRQQFLLKNFEAENEAKLQMQKALLEGGKDVDQLPSKFFDQEIQIGSNTYKMKRGVNPSNLQSVFVDPVTDSAEIVNSYNKTMGGLKSISEMEKLTRDLIDISNEQVGGITAVRFLDAAEGVLKSMGLTKGNFFDSLKPEELKELGTRKLSIESEIDTIRRAFIMRFKRFISQETGNGISNVDVKNIQDASGDLETLFSFRNPEASLKAFKEIRQIFDDSALALNRAIEQFTDRREYYDGAKGDELYTRTMEAMQKGLTLGQELGLVEAKVVKNDDGSELMVYDLTDLATG
tara:strand:- start:8738 stop:10618 length:1881 start_codon:yes stop_codon:yes gene_type:complete